MEAKRVHAIYFSPALTTKAVVRAVAGGISENVISYDITQGIKKAPEFSEGDIAVIGVPSYSGRVPALAAKWLSELRSESIPAVLVCVYGNREYEDTLLELNEVCVRSGFKPISAGAFIARHSIFPHVAQGRPDATDLGAARDFGRSSLEIKGVGELHLKGNYPYRETGVVPLKPRASRACDGCGICVKACPTGAISADNPRRTDKTLCIACARCIALCPKKCRQFRGLLYSLVRRQFTKKNKARKENEYFFTV